MKKTTVFKRLLSLALVLSVLLGWALPANALDKSISFQQVSNDSIYGDLFDREPMNIQEDVKRYADSDLVRVSIILNTPGTIEAGFDPDGIANNKDAMKYRAKLKDEQVSVVDNIEDATNEELDIVWNMTLAANLISANITYGQVETIAKVSGVKAVVVEEAYNPAVVSSSVADPNMLTSGIQTGAPNTHAAGYSGAGSRIAIIDTGLDIEHISVDAGAYYYSLGELASAKGMTPDDYIASLNLLDMAEIADVLDELNVMDRVNVDADDLYVNTKVPFGFNYIDADLDIVHEMDEQGNHGSHVAGIAAANTYVPAGNGAYELATDVGAAQGVAPDAQLIIMKVFGKNGGAFPSDYMVAIEDAIVLGADSINLSLGSGVAGMTYTTETAYQLIMDNLVNSGTVVTMSAGNNGAWMDESQTGIPYLYIDDVNMHTGGSPGTYTNSLGIASMNNAGYISTRFLVGDDQATYLESLGYGNKPIASLSGEIEYVFLNNIGTVEQFNALGVSLQDKLVLCYRGETSFFEKANAAASLGAKAIAIINNTDGGIILNLTGYTYTAPVVSLYQEGGECFKNNGTPILGADNAVLGWTGTTTIDAGNIHYYDDPYYTMSSFSSWGVPGDLSMKPEITAPGGDIHSISGAYKYNGQMVSNDHATFEVMSGTSMAAPQVAGMAALVAQYIKENNLAEKTGVNIRALAQSLLMSTAVPILDGNNNGYYYSVLQQGAGRADVSAAVSADSYLIMGEDATKSYADGKVKVELGDDPQKKGEYTFSFTINNLTNEEKTYLLTADFFSQNIISAYGLLFMDTMTTPLAPNVSWLVNGKAVDSGADLVGMDFNGDGYINSHDGQAILDYAVGAISALSNAALADIDSDNDVDSYDAYLFFQLLGNNGAVVPANGSAEIKVTVTLTDNDKAWLDVFENGTYLEGYVYAESLVSEEGVQGTSHSIPVLGFYGNWSDASMYDKGSYLEYAHGEENRPPYLYESNLTMGKTNGFGVVYANDPQSEYWFGGNPYDLDETYMPERNALNPSNTVISSVGFTPIRNAAQMYLEAWDPATGGYYLRQMIADYSPSYATYYSPSQGSWQYTYEELSLGLSFNGMPNNLPVEIGITSVLEYNVNSDGSVNWEDVGKGATFSVPMVMDSSNPAVTDIQIDGDILKVTATDNQYIAKIGLYDALGQTILAEADSDPNQNAGDTVVFNLDISNVNGISFLLFVADYATNGAVYSIDVQIGDVTDEISGVEISETDLTMFKGNTASLSAAAMPMNAVNRQVTWSSSDNTIATVDANGTVLAKAVGTADIIATSVADPTKSAVCHVTVMEIDTDLNAFVWDEQGEVYYSSINTTSLPNYTKLNKMSVDIATACVGPNGIIYGASFGSGRGSLYAIDPITYEPTEIGKAMVQGQNIMYTDIDYSYNAMGTGALFASYQSFLIWVDPTTGEGVPIDQYPANIVGVACLGDYMYPYQGQNYLLTDIMVILADGTVYYNAYASISTGPTRFGAYGAISTGVSLGDAWYFNSAYFDGNYLFWSALNPNSQNQATLYAIDAFGTGETYALGKSPSGVWPIGGLHQNAAAAGPISNNAISAFELNVTLGEEKTFDLAAYMKAQKNTASPMADAVVEEEADLITLKVTAADLADGLITNGVTSVEYDAEALELKSILVDGDYVASAKEDGKVTFGYIDFDGVDADTVVATLVFEAKAPNAKPAKITYLEANNAKPATSEDVEVAYPHEHTKVINEKDPTCTEPGYTGDIYCEDCDEIIAKGREIEATGHQDTEIIGAKDATYTEPGYTGDTYCHDCDRVVAKGKEIPKKTPEGNGPPKTDDQSFFGLGLMLMLTSVSAIAVLTVSKKKYHN